jgi:hypothetical protein
MAALFPRPPPYVIVNWIEDGEVPRSAAAGIAGTKMCIAIVPVIVTATSNARLGAASAEKRAGKNIDHRHGFFTAMP